MAQPLLFTIGHSTLPIGTFVHTLQNFGIRSVVDIRTIPKSKRNPQFTKEALEKELNDHGIGYVPMKDLGGLRKPVENSVNVGWRNPSFRGYADYMQTEKFEKALEALAELARGTRLVIMCAEAVPWRCHRSLVADALIVRGFAVQNIFSETEAKTHLLNPMAKVEGTKLVYPGDSSSQLELFNSPF